MHKKLNMWLPIGGHIESDEDPEEALFREVDEECGLKVTILSNKPTLKASGIKFLLTPNYLDIHEISAQHRHVGLVYFAITGSDTLSLDEQEHSDIRWFDKSNLDDPKYNLKPAVVFYANAAINHAREPK